MASQSGSNFQKLSQWPNGSSTGLWKQSLGFDPDGCMQEGEGSSKPS